MSVYVLIVTVNLILYDDVFHIGLFCGKLYLLTALLVSPSQVRELWGCFKSFVVFLIIRIGYYKENVPAVLIQVYLNLWYFISLLKLLFSVILSKRWNVTKSIEFTVRWNCHGAGVERVGSRYKGVLVGERGDAAFQRTVWTLIQNL